MTDVTPVTALESKLEEARSGQSSMSDFLHTFSESNIIVPSGSEIMPDGSGFQPVMFDKGGSQMVACFTAMERIGDFARVASYCLSIKGSEFLKRIPTGYGLVVNPGQSLGFDVTPDGIRQIVAELA